MLKRIYVAGPISKGDQFTNVRNAVIAASKLRAVGYAPFVPHLTCIWHMMSPDDYEAWMEYDFAWIVVCDALVRLDGESPGSDREVVYARSIGKPVFFGVDAAIKAILSGEHFTNGSGGTNLIYPTQAEAESRAGDFRAEGKWCEVVPRREGGEWEVVMLGAPTK